MTTARQQKSQGGDSAGAGYESDLWRMADALRGSMDAAEYKHVVLGLIFSSTSPTPSRKPTPSWRPSATKAPTRRTRTSIAPRTSSGCPPMPAGPISRRTRASPPLGRPWTRPWPPWSGRTQRCGACCPRTTRGRRWTSSGWGRLSTSSATSRSAGPRRRPPTCWAGYTSTSWVNSPFWREGRAASSTPRAPSSGCWWRCWSPTAAGSTTRAAARRACSCSRWTSSAPTPPATATAAGPGATSPSTAKSPTTRPGGWPR